MAEKAATAIDFFSIDNSKKMKPKARALVRDLVVYYSPEKITAELVPFIEGKDNISGRMCDYVLTTYAKKVFCPLGEYDIRQLYDLTLRETGGRCHFDPFSRLASGIPVHFEHEGRLFTTTVAQMNFVRWYYRYGLDTFMVKNRRRISEDMKKTYRSVKLAPKSGVKRKRQVSSNDKHCTVVLFGEKTIFL